MDRIRTSMPKTTQYQTRAEDGNLYIEGYFVVFGDHYEMWDNAFEVIGSGAFDETLGGDIRALTNHDSTLVLGRSTAGTLSLQKDTKGIWGQITINRADQDAVNLYERVKRGDVSQCSFGFDILDETVDYKEDGTTVWTLNKVKLYEVSVVTFPAYEATSVEARKKDYEKIKEKRISEKKLGLIKLLKGAK